MSRARGAAVRSSHTRVTAPLMLAVAITLGVASMRGTAQEDFASSALGAGTGQQLYNRYCLSCHQADGGGVPRLQPPILDSAWVKGEPVPLALFVLTGGLDSAGRKESANHNVMPAFPQLSDEDLALLLTYVRQRFGDGAGPVSPLDVAAARSSTTTTTTKE